ncbi:MAG: hypothetical protein PHS37_09810, partial [Candidatus Omnitrophica bacterium]|nr:hypothetical protein [Candidatus Omnitrophota bacterium]
MRMIIKKSGYTFSEVFIVLLMGTALLGIVISGWLVFYRTCAFERAKARQRVNVEVALEKIKTELRLSSATYTSGYPIGGTSFTAISF